MISVSQKFLELMQSNIRPKIEPTITVKGQDSEGNQVVLTWKPSNIQNMTYKRGIDPVGRTLPYMELTWTEIYYGKLNAENYPEKYNNIVKYMAVELSFEQSLGFFNTWKDLYSAGYTWKNVLEQFKTWKGVKRGVSKETVKLPTMFLVAKPTIQGQTITWTARDLLYFLTETQTKSFTADVPYRNALRWFLLEERANFKNSKEILGAIQNTQNSILSGDTATVGKNTVLDGSSKQILTGLASIKNYHWNFAVNSAKLVPFKNALAAVSPVYTFTSNVMYDYPKLTALPTIAGYSCKQYVCELDEENQYTLEPYETVTYKNATFYHYAFKGLGEYKYDSLSMIAKSAYSRNSPLTVTPANLNSVDLYLTLNQKGEEFIEDNACNPYGKSDRDIKNRISFLNEYFKKGSYSAEINSLPNLAIEPGDLVVVETNLFSGNNRITKKALVLSIELEYNGALKQKTIVHTR